MFCFTRATADYDLLPTEDHGLLPPQPPSLLPNIILSVLLLLCSLLTLLITGYHPLCIAVTFTARFAVCFIELHTALACILMLLTATLTLVRPRGGKLQLFLVTTTGVYSLIESSWHFLWAYIEGEWTESVENWSADIQPRAFAGFAMLCYASFSLILLMRLVPQQPEDDRHVINS